MYDGNHRLHGQKFLGLSFPDGLIAMYGPYAGTRHDGAMFLAASIVAVLTAIRARGDGWWAIFSDSAFPLGSHCFRMNRSPVTNDERVFNRIWAKIRIANEWCFSHVGQFFSSLHFAHGLQMCKRNVGGRTQTSVLFWNLHACWNGSETASYFKIDTPSPNFIFEVAPTGNLPDFVQECV